MKTLRLAWLAGLTAVTVTIASCGLLPQGAQDWMVETGIGDINPEGHSSTSSRSRCAVCSGIGYKEDPNSGRAEMCHYC